MREPNFLDVSAMRTAPTPNQLPNGVASPFMMVVPLDMVVRLRAWVLDAHVGFFLYVTLRNHQCMGMCRCCALATQS